MMVRVRALLLALLVVGCDGATISDGPCSLTEPCGSSAVCDFTAEGGPVCIPKDGDLDGDGLTNDKDFCHHQAGGAFDEDGDGIGDDCDRCPIAPPRSTPDSDNDLVDAPCDPSPSTDGDEILFFDGFQNGLDPRWMPTTASAWKVQGGELIATLAGVPEQEFLKIGVVGKNTIAIEASFRVDKIETSASRHLVGVYAADPRPAGAAQMACYVTKADAAPDTELVVVETNLGAMNMATAGAFNSANIYRVGATAMGTRAGCVVLANGNPLGAVQGNITADQLSQVALTVHATSVRYQYVLVVGH
jgi:hypothetical protein